MGGEQRFRELIDAATEEQLRKRLEALTKK
jgi:hypothetical protein